MKLEAILQKLGLLQPGKIMYIGGSDVLPAPLRPEDERRRSRSSRPSPRWNRATRQPSSCSSSIIFALSCISRAGSKTPVSIWRT